jgi:predicted murein hydrolase (TIGR00659 family)
MTELLNIPILPLIVTLLAYQAGLLCQKKLRSPLCNPILVAVVLVLVFLFATGMELEVYQAGASYISWLLTPVTVCLAIPMYEQLQILLKNWKAILAGITGGAIGSLIMVAAMAALAGFDQTLTITLLPKSVTTAIGAPLSELSGGMPAVTTAVIIFTGILANALSPLLIPLFRLKDEISAGVALGTSGHAVGTSKANELSPLTGAISSLSLVTAGILTSVLFPLAIRLFT